MKPRPKVKLSRLRFLKAYYVTFVILFRYFWLMILSKFLDEQRAHELFNAAHQKTARQITHTLLQLKGFYIKIGQGLSVMSNILPAELTEGLELLQDRVPPHPFEEVNERFLTDFGKTKEIKKYPINKTNLARDLIHFYCKQIFIDGLYHADPHPGNIIIQKDGGVP